MTLNNQPTLISSPAEQLVPVDLPNAYPKEMAKNASLYKTGPMGTIPHGKASTPQYMPMHRVLHGW